jgi:hypothetical protein
VIENTLTKYGPGTAGTPGTKVFSDTLEGTVATVHKTMTGADGSLYVLADVDGATSSQTIKGDQDVALLKYDSRASCSTRAPWGGRTPPPATTWPSRTTARWPSPVRWPAVVGRHQRPDQFRFRRHGHRQLRHALRRQGRRDLDGAARRHAGGRGHRRGVRPGRRRLCGRPHQVGPSRLGHRRHGKGGYDSYLTGFATDIAGTPKALFTTHFGSENDDTVAGIVVNGTQVVVASKEGSEAMLRSFNVTTSIVTENRTA